MNDTLFVTVCNHKVQNYKLTIRERDGRYFAKLPAVPVRDTAKIFIRSWEDERNYIDSVSDYTDLKTYLNFDARYDDKDIDPATEQLILHGPRAIIGIRNYAFVAEDEIEFLRDEHGKLPIEVDENIVPKPVYLIDFVCDEKYCPRCSGTRVIKDIFLYPSGITRQITGAEKIKQRVVKALITPLGWDLSDPNFGSELSSMVGKIITEDIHLVLQTTVMNCVRHLIEMQPNTYSDEETIVSLDSMSIEDLSNGNNNEAFAVKVIVTNRLGERIDCSVAFSLE